MRPEGWDNKWITTDVDEPATTALLTDNKFKRMMSPKERAIFEAGADAILEGLKKKGFGYVDGCSREALEVFTNYVKKKSNQKGYLVFIEE